MKVQIDAVDKVKAHLKEHKREYIIGGVCLGIGLLIGKRLGANKMIADAIIKGGHDNVIDASQKVLTDNSTNFTTNIFGSKALSKIVENTETGEVFLSQALAAKTLGIDPSTLSRHLNTGSPLPTGDVFVRRGIAA